MNNFRGVGTDLNRHKEFCRPLPTTRPPHLVNKRACPNNRPVPAYQSLHKSTAVKQIGKIIGKHYHITWHVASCFIAPLAGHPLCHQPG